MRILLIEGNNGYGDNIKNKLQSYGHTVYLTDTSDGAQLLFETKPFDMIIVELSTPEDSIIEFLAYLRCTNKETPVYALSADYASSTAFKDLKFDMVDVLNSRNHTTQSLTSQRDSIIAPRVVQPKTFHNFCLN